MGADVTSGARPRSGRRARRRRWLLLLALPPALAALLLTRPLREPLLRLALPRLLAGLPGGGPRLTGLSWPRLGRLESRRLNWIVSGDTLLAATDLAVDLELWPLRTRDLRLRELTLHGLRLDLPALRRAFPGDTSKAGPRRFPRSGSLGGLPSLACARLEISGGPLRLDSLRTLSTLELAGAVELGAGREPSLRLDRLRLAMTPNGTALNGGTLVWEPARGQADGRLALSLAGWRLGLELKPAGPDRLELGLSLGDSLRQVAALDLSARLVRRGADWRGATLDGRLRLAETKELRRVPRLAPALARLPDLPELTAALAGTVHWFPALDLELALRSPGAGWLEAVRARFNLDGSGMRLDSLLVRAFGLQLDGHVRMEGDSLWAGLEAGLTQAAPLRALPGLQALPEDLQADLSLQAAGPRRGWPAIQGRLHASSAGLQLDLAARAESDSLVRIDALRVDDLGRASAPDAARGGGTLRRTADGGWALRSLRLAGALGDAELDGQIDNRGAGDFTLAWSLSRLSPALARRLGLADSLGRKLDHALAAGAPLALHARGRLERSDAGRRLEAAGDLAAPGPARLAALLPRGARLEGLDDLAADWTLAWQGGGHEPSRWRAGLEAQAAGWLEELAAALSGEARGLQLDTLAARLPGILLDARGQLAGPLMGLEARWALDDLGFLARLQPWLAGKEAGLAGRLSLRGRRDNPQLDLGAAGRWKQPGLELPDLQLAARRDSLGLRAVCWAPGGLQGEGWKVDTLAARFAGPAGPGALLLPGRLWLRESGADQAVETELLLRREAGWRAEGLRLHLRAGEGLLETSRPFLLALPASGGLALDSLEMKGSLGLLSAQARLLPDSSLSRLDLSADLALGRLPWLATLPVDLRRSTGRLHLTASETGGLQGRLSLDSLSLRLGEVLDLALELDGPLDGPALAARVTQAEDTLLRADGRLPARLALWPPSLRPSLEQLDFNLELDQVPLLAAVAGDFAEGTDWRLSGQARLSGSAQSPRLTGGLFVEAPRDPRLAGYRGDMKLDLGPVESLSLLKADLALSHEGRSLAVGALSLPLQPAAGGWLRPAPDGLEASLEARSLSLEELNPLLPYDLWTKGRGDLELRATGAPLDPRLSGQARLDKLELSRSDGTHLFGSARLTLGGRARRPELRGWLELENGETRLPELPRDLHETKGKALLWQLAATGPDSVAAPLAATGFALQDSLDMEVELRIPDRVRLRSGELDLQGRGRLTVRRKAGATGLVGDLEVLSGQFRLLGREFLVESGTLSWFGDEVLTPRMDLQLVSTIGSTRVMIRLTGLLDQPLLELSSEPAMDEGEIMALLLFRRSTEELDNQQQDVLERQAAQVAADYGMAALQARLTGALRLDVLRWEAGEAQDRGTLLVGKYLGPRLLLRYEQSLSQQDLFRVSVDYVLSRHLRLETSTGSRGQSGLTLNWNRTW